MATSGSVLITNHRDQMIQRLTAGAGLPGMVESRALHDHLCSLL